jgi:DNA-binding NarL/FixJ family response regulator
VIRVLLADDQALVRAGFRLLLESAGDIAVIAEAVNGGEAVALTREHAPDVVLMDINMPEVDGVTATHLIASDPRLAATKVVVLTTFDDEETVFAALRAGASGFLVKDVEPEELLQAVRVVARGDALLSPSVTRAVIGAFTATGGSPNSRPPRAPGSGRACGAAGPRVADRAREGSRRAGRLRTVQRRDRPRARGQPAHREDPRQPGDDQAERPRPGAAGDAGLRARPDRVLGALSLAALAALAALAECASHRAAR